MTVNELFELLQERKNEGLGEASVHFGYNYGDHARTLVAPEVKTMDLAEVKPSAYHNMDRAVSVVGEFGDEDEDEDEDNTTTVVLLR